MSTRTGTCNSCGQRYGDIPDSVTETEVKCQVCSGTVVIPPLAASPPASPEPAAAANPAPSPGSDSTESTTGKIPPAPEPASAAGGLTAKSLAGEQKKTDRPAAAAPVDRTVARPKKGVSPVAKKPAGKAPGKPVFARKTAAPAKPLTPIKAAKPGKPAAAAKAATPAPPVARTKPGQPVASSADSAGSGGQADAAKKAKAADIIARAKAKRVQEPAQPDAAPVKKASGADLIAQLKAKKESGSEAAAAVAQTATPAASSTPRTKKSQNRNRAVIPKKKKGRSRAEREESGRNAREHANEGSGLKLVVISVVGLGVLAGGWYWMKSLEKDVPVTPDTTEVSADGASADPSAPAAADTTSLPPSAPIVAPAADTSDPDSGDNTSVAGTGTEAGSDTGGDPGTEAAKPAAAKPAAPSAEFIPPAPGEAANTVGISDFFALDLSLIPEIPKWEQISDEDYASIQEDLALFMDDQGVFSTRAGDRLIDYGRGGYAVVVNNLLDQDFSTKEGLYIGTTLNDLLYKICNSNKNFGWENTAAMEEGSEEFLKKALVNKKIAAKWYSYWYIQKFATNDQAWAKMCGLDKKPDAEKAPVENSTDDLFDD
jgi:hypothetical protein